MIRWITGNLGTAAHDRLSDGDWTVIDVRHLVDKAGNVDEEIRQLIARGVSVLRCSKRVVVVCDFGISRSNAIAAGILAQAEGGTVDAALSEVTKATGETQIKLDLVCSVKRALGEDTQPQGEATLVTGATGFLGSHLLRRLQKSGNAWGGGRESLDLLGDTTQLAAICQSRGVGQIVHLAHPRIYTNADAVGSSMVMLRNILDVCRLLNIKLILVSDAVVFGGSGFSRAMVHEDAPFAPSGPYAETKYLEEILVDLHARRGDVMCAICRLTPVYGPGGARPRLIQAFWQKIIRDEEIKTHLYRNGRPALDLLYVDDAVDGLARVIEASASGVFHFGTGELHTTIEIAEVIAGVVGRRLRHSEILIDGNISNVAFPATRARKELGWAPKVDLVAGLTACLMPPP